MSYGGRTEPMWVFDIETADDEVITVATAQIVNEIASMADKPDDTAAHAARRTVELRAEWHKGGSLRPYAGSEFDSDCCWELDGLVIQPARK